MKWIERMMEDGKRRRRSARIHAVRRTREHCCAGRRSGTCAWPLRWRALAAHSLNRTHPRHMPVGRSCSRRPPWLRQSVPSEGEDGCVVGASTGGAGRAETGQMRSWTKRKVFQSVDSGLEDGAEWVGDFWEGGM